MEFDIQHKTEFAYLTVKVPPEKTLFVEASAMAAMDTNVVMKTKMRGGLSRFLSRESLFINQYTAQHGAGEVSIAPGPLGSIGHYPLAGQNFYIASSCYVAHSEGVTFETKFQGVGMGLFSGAGLFLVKMSGHGDVWFNSYGALVEIDVKDQYVVDTGHIVAFTEGLEREIGKVGGYKSLFFSGEGLVCKFSGQGKVWMQTKKPTALINWAHFYRRVKQQN